jgi:hypothetical protein
MPLDPTQSITLRRRFASLGNAYYNRVQVNLGPLLRELYSGQRLVVFDDGRGISSFEQEFRSFFDRTNPDFNLSILGGFRKGVHRAYAEVRQSEYLKVTPIGRQEFMLRVMAGNGASVIQELSSRFRSEWNGINEAVVQQVLRTLADAIGQGHPIATVYRLLRDRIEKVGKSRFQVLAHDTIIRAHAEGQLAAFGVLGITRVQAEVETLNAGDNRVCPTCRGVLILTIDKAHNVLPRHARCRCRWKLVEVDKKLLQSRRAQAAFDLLGPERTP